ncbi:Thioesterase/thiol ester dehydrase-isomerase [Serendipita vermifera]|nr:Thioesterase/thiol ester dehydrase-isomerase [Serendipita vermifera]
MQRQLGFTLRTRMTGYSQVSRLVRTTWRSASTMTSEQLNPANEIKDVAELDRLLELVRDRSDPVHRCLMPMRVPQLWVESLRASSSTGTASPAVDTSKRTTSELAPRPMHHSYSEFVLPFASDPAVLEQYTNARGGIRTGKLMEDLDALAGGVAYKHLMEPGVTQLRGGTNERGFYVVTASVERLDMLTPLTPKNVKDLRLSGQVIYTGKSSMEVVVKMEALGHNNSEETIMLGRFTMVCLDAFTHKARRINPLIPSTEDEKALYAMGEALKERRQLRGKQSLDQNPPTSEEAARLHQLYLKYRDGQPGSDGIEPVPIGKTLLENTMQMYPQQRNIHSKVFGGYLMRLAYELGYSNATIFTRGSLRFLSLDEITFKHPVPIGSVLRLRSKIAHTVPSAPGSVHVAVVASVIDDKTGDEKTTNEFRFTWGSADSGFSRTVVPKTYEEAMLWLEASRALKVGSEIRGMREST